MVEEVWEVPFVVMQQEFVAVFMRRPFREGLEVHCDVHGKRLRVAEFGYGETALLELLRECVARELGLAG